MSDEFPDQAYDEILAEVLEAHARGEAATLEELARRHPGQEERIRRALDSIASYRRFRAQLTRSSDSHIEDLAAGERVGDFEIVGRLAAGGMGVVYRARQLSLGRRIVALKVLATGSSDLHGAARFQREALQLAGLHHPHLAEVYGFGEDRGRLFLAMRLIEGANLRDILEARATQRALRGDPREMRMLVDRITEVADALALAHARGLVHRDVKPSNIVLDGDERSLALHNAAVLVDFGLARPVDERVPTLTGVSPATPSYAPPEQLLGQSVDARADVFSLGVTLHDLLSARRPSERMQASAGLEPLRELAPDVDADLAAIIARAVDPEARWRYADAAALRDDLRAWLRGDPVSARSPPWRERAWRALSRNPRGLVRAFVLAAALIAGLVGFSLGPGAELQRLARAREHHERGDLLELARTAQALSGTTARLVGRRGSFASALTQARSAAPNDPLGRVCAALEMNDMSSALVAAATALGAEPQADHELLERFFLACERETGMRARLREHDADTWAILIARLFYERPVETLADLDRAERHRAVVVDALRRTDSSETSRRFLATALGGLGQLEDGPPLLLDPIAPPDTDLELVRLHLHNTTRILRRARAMGLSAATPFDEYWSALRPVAERLRELDLGSRPFGVTKELLALVTELAVAQHSLGLSLPCLVDWVPMRARIELDAGRCTNLEGWAIPLAAAGDPWLLAHIAGRSLGAFASTQAVMELGQLARWLEARPDLAARCEEQAALAGEAGWRSDYEAGNDWSRDLLLGVFPGEQLDADTRLGWRPRSEQLAPMHGRRASIDRAPNFGVPSASFTAEQWHTLSALEMLRPEASWWWCDGQSHWSDAAHAPRAVAVNIGSEGEQQFARMHAFGISELELRFEASSESLEHSRWLVLTLQKNDRSGYPNRGEPHLQISLNGVALMTTLAVRNYRTAQPVALDVSRVRAGLNDLCLRLLATSTTPLRLHDARVVACSAAAASR